MSPFTEPSVAGGLWYADAGLADLADDPLVADEEDAAVVGVGDGHRPVGQDVRVVGPVEVGRVVPDDSRHAEEIRRPVGLDVDREDVLVILLVRDERLASGLDERVVVEDEVGAARAVAGRREVPEDVMVRVDEEDAVVAAVGDEDRARQWAAGGDDPIRLRLRLRFRGRRRGRRAAPMVLDERAEKRDRREHGENDGKARPHVVTLAVAL